MVCSFIDVPLCRVCVCVRVCIFPQCVCLCIYFLVCVPLSCVSVCVLAYFF